MRRSTQMPGRQDLTYQLTHSIASSFALLALAVAAVGCDSKKPDTAKKGETTTATAQPDDANAVAVLKNAKAVLKMNKAGSGVEVVDMEDAGGGNVELFKAAAKLPSLKVIICTGPMLPMKRWLS